jgi:methionyl-tRNA formyltransferase
MNVSDDGVTVQSVGGRILVKRVKPQGGAKMPAAQWAQEAGLKVGDTLGE